MFRFCYDDIGKAFFIDIDIVNQLISKIWTAFQKAWRLKVVKALVDWIKPEDGGKHKIPEKEFVKYGDMLLDSNIINE